MPTGIYIRTEKIREGIRKSCLGRKQSVETIQKRIIANKHLIINGILFNEKHRKNLSLATLGKKKGSMSESHKSLISKALKGKSKPFGFGLKVGAIQKGKKESEETRRMHRELWKNPEYIRKFIRQNGPNRLETKLQGLLNDILPGEYQFVGDGKFILAGKCPDFLNEKRKKLIEFFGNHWHQNDDFEARVKLFKDCGYETLIIWQTELKDLEIVKRRVLEYTLDEVKPWKA